MPLSKSVGETVLERIVSLEPSVSATLVALGQRHRLVGVTRYCSRLVDVIGLPKLDTTWSAKAEAIAALKPDLVIAGVPYREGKVDELLREGLSVLCLYPQSLDDVYNHIEWLGTLCSVPDRAEALIDEMRSTLAGFQERSQRKPRQRVYVEVWPDPPMTATRWVAEIVEALGGVFVPKGAGRPVDGEEVIAADPELILLCWAGVEEIDPARVGARPGWDQISAVRARRVIPLNEILVNAPGPNLIEGMHEIWWALYPS